MPAQRLTSAEFPFRLWAHQRAAIKAYESCPDPTRCHLTLPPGAGKTLVGAEIARRCGRKTVVLVPNAAVQGQWVQQWRLLGTDIVTVGEDLGATADITLLTYQDITTGAGDDPFDPDRTDSSNAPAQRPQLRPDTTAFLRRLASGPPFTLILDEAHHFAATCADVLDEVLTEDSTHSHGQDQDQDRSNPIVIALSSTPHDMLAPDQLELVDRLFGPLTFTTSTPALVRDQALAPFRDLVRFATPTEAERTYLRRSSVRWRELIAGLTDPDFTDAGFIPFLNEHWIQGTSTRDGGSPASGKATGSAEPVQWQVLERSHPDIARALLRFHFDSRMVDLPVGAQLTEEHRQPLTSEDWVVLISDYGRRALATSESERDKLAWEQIRSALGSIGWTLTRRGVRRELAPADLVLLQSAAKAVASATILEHEHELRGSALRAAIVTDNEHAPAPTQAPFPDALGPTSGTAYEALLQADQALPELSPVLVTGETVAGSPGTMNRLIDFVANGNPSLAGKLRTGPLPDSDGMVSLSGAGWHPRVWLPVVTGWFLAGGTRVLVGTRGLLGAGWDAPGLNVLVDLTTATSATTAVRVRGRAIRMDPADPQKSANIWSVVVVSDDHPLGDLDYRRFVTKHEGFQAADPAGRIVAGAAHVDPECGPFAPPNPKMRTAVNIRMMDAATRTAELPLLWGVGLPYEDVDVPMVQVRGCEGEALRLDVAQAAIRPWSRTRGLVPATGAAVGAGLPIIAAAPPSQALVWACVGGVAGWGADAGSRWAARRRTVGRTTPADTLLAIGMAVAQGMDLDPALVDVAPDGDGVWQVLYSGGRGLGDAGSTRLSMLDDRGQESFVSAMEEVLSPVGWPGYLISRQLPRKNTEIWHAVPNSLGKNPQAADHFHRAWVEFVSDARLVQTNDPEGAGILTSVRGLNPGDVCAGVRVAWS